MPSEYIPSPTYQCWVNSRTPYSVRTLSSPKSYLLKNASIIPVNNIQLEYTGIVFLVCFKASTTCCLTLASMCSHNQGLLINASATYEASTNSCPPVHC